MNIITLATILLLNSIPSVIILLIGSLVLRFGTDSLQRIHLVLAFFMKVLILECGFGMPSLSIWRIYVHPSTLRRNKLIDNHMIKAASILFRTNRPSQYDCHTRSLSSNSEANLKQKRLNFKVFNLSTTELHLRHHS